MGEILKTTRVNKGHLHNITMPSLLRQEDR